jgi:pimeloyl-ACP methyl ester carboxylesterase
MPAPSAHRRVRLVDAGGVRLRTSVRGSGPPLLLITGLGTSLDLGVPLEEELAARGLQAVSFDAPGVGESSNYRWPPRMPGIARTVGHMLEALGYHRVDALGVSLGGVVAQQLAHQAPHRVRRLILAATGPGLGGVPGSRSALLPLAMPRRYYQPDYYRRVAGRVYGRAAREDPDALLHGSPARFTAQRTSPFTASGAPVNGSLARSGRSAHNRNHEIVSGQDAYLAGSLAQSAPGIRSPSVLARVRSSWPSTWIPMAAHRSRCQVGNVGCGTARNVP